MRRNHATVAVGLALLLGGHVVPSAHAAPPPVSSPAPAATHEHDHSGDPDAYAGAPVAAPPAGSNETPGVTSVTNALVTGAAPVAPVGQPAQVDYRPVYTAQVACDPVDRPGTRALGAYLVRTFGAGSVGYSRFCAGGGQSEHYDGRALDWMLDANKPDQKATADAAAAWMTADGGTIARRLGVQYIIWNKAMWRAYAPERGWVAYTGSNPHTDHIHISLGWDGAMARTSWWTGAATMAQDLGPCVATVGNVAQIYTGKRTGGCPAPKPGPATTMRTWLPGHKSTEIAKAQSLLGLAADGSFGYSTRTTLIAYQKRASVPVTGVLDQPTWGALLGPSALVPAPGAATTTPTPSAPVKAPTPKPAPPAATAALKVTTPASAHKGAVLRQGSRGPSVAVLQRLLGVRATGTFAAETKHAVIATQKRWKLPATGVVNARTWNRAELTRYPWLAYAGARLQTGSRGPAVTAVQRALRVPADGQFGPATATALRAAQKRLGVPASGMMDAATWRAFPRL